MNSMNGGINSENTRQQFFPYCRYKYVFIKAQQRQEVKYKFATLSNISTMVFIYSTIFRQYKSYFITVKPNWCVATLLMIR